MILYTTVVATSLLAILFMSNFFKYKLGYLTIGSLFLVFITIETMVATKVVRDVNSW